MSRPTTFSKTPALLTVLKVLFAFAIAAAMWWLVWAMVNTHYHWINATFLAAAILMLVALFMYRTARRWSRPMQALIQLIPQIQTGAAPIDDLSKIGRGMTPLVPILRDLLHELKMQKMHVAKLNQETEQRVAGRTSALERQIGSLKHQAVKDALTGLFNRRMFDAHLPAMVEQCAKTKLDFSLLAIDVDNFKQLNDTLGHAAGDELLRNIGQIISSGIRQEDAAFRVGGDEFMIMLCGAKLEPATKLAGRLVDLVDALAKPLRLENRPRLSIGVASCSQLSAGGKIQDLVELADKNLYEVKSERRRISPRIPLAKAG
jgi:diguanylate cyclase (GGDEF)-like protein